MLNYDSKNPAGNFERFVTEKMHEQRESVLRYFVQLVGTELAENIALCVARAYSLDDNAALSIADSLGLTQLDMLAVEGNISAYFNLVERFRCHDEYHEDLILRRLSMQRYL